VFARLDRLRELLKLVDYLREFRPEPFGSGEGCKTPPVTAGDEPPESVR
jgi:hypothetical protein